MAGAVVESCLMLVNVVLEMVTLESAALILLVAVVLINGLPERVMEDKVPAERVREDPLRETREAVAPKVNDLTVTVSSLRVDPDATAIKVAVNSSCVSGDKVTDSNALSPVIPRAVALPVKAAGSNRRELVVLDPVKVRLVIWRVVVTVVVVSMTRTVSASGSRVSRSSVKTVSGVTGISSLFSDFASD